MNLEEHKIIQNVLEKGYIFSLGFLNVRQHRENTKV